MLVMTMMSILLRDRRQRLKAVPLPSLASYMYHYQVRDLSRPYSQSMIVLDVRQLAICNRDCE